MSESDERPVRNGLGRPYSPAFDVVVTAFTVATATVIGVLGGHVLPLPVALPSYVIVPLVLGYVNGLVSAPRPRGVVRRFTRRRVEREDR